ncbi:MAG: YdcF family protein [Pseudomonadota bacterium]
MTKRNNSDDPRYLFVLGAPNDEQGGLSEISLNRIELAVSISRLDPEVRVIATGGHGDHFNRTDRPHHRYVADELAKHGVQTFDARPHDFLSSNTVEDAVQISGFINVQQVSKIEVVTSEFHIERCRFIFDCLMREQKVDFHAAKNPADAELQIIHERNATKRLIDQGGVVIGKDFFPAPR